MTNDINQLGIDEETRRKYLEDGEMSQQFLSSNRLDRKMARAKNDNEKVKILYRYIHAHTRNANFVSKKYKATHKFQRTAGEIWHDKKMTGCTDYALVFSTLARKYGLPTTILDTVEQGCFNGLQNNKSPNGVNGHAFCEVLVDGKWVLADPTFKKTEANYDPQNVKLTGLHNVLGKQKFVSISRQVDTMQRQSIKEHNENLKKLIVGEEPQESIQEAPESEVTPVTTQEISDTGYYEQSAQNNVKDESKEQGKEEAKEQAKEHGDEKSEPKSSENNEEEQMNK